MSRRSSANLNVHLIGGRSASAPLLVLSLLLAAAAMADGGWFGLGGKKQVDSGSAREGAARPDGSDDGQNGPSSGCLPPRGAKTHGNVVLPSPWLLVRSSAQCQAHAIVMDFVTAIASQRPWPIPGNCDKTMTEWHHVCMRANVCGLGRVKYTSTAYRCRMT